MRGPRGRGPGAPEVARPCQPAPNPWPLHPLAPPTSPPPQPQAAAASAQPGPAAGLDLSWAPETHVLTGGPAGAGGCCLWVCLLVVEEVAGGWPGGCAELSHNLLPPVWGCTLHCTGGLQCASPAVTRPSLPPLRAPAAGLAAAAFRASAAAHASQGRRLWIAKPTAMNRGNGIQVGAYVAVYMCMWLCMWLCACACRCGWLVGWGVWLYAAVRGVSRTSFTRRTAKPLGSSHSLTRPPRQPS
jgi:hypothetical protein